jgi:hypothetical protein
MGLFFEKIILPKQEWNLGCGKGVYLLLQQIWTCWVAGCKAGIGEYRKMSRKESFGRYYGGIKEGLGSNCAAIGEGLKTIRSK